MQFRVDSENINQKFFKLIELLLYSIHVHVIRSDGPIRSVGPNYMFMTVTVTKHKQKEVQSICKWPTTLVPNLEPTQSNLTI